MKRRLFTLASALSLLLLVGTAVLWVRSHFSEDVISICHENWGGVTGLDYYDLPEHPEDKYAEVWSVNGQWEFIFAWSNAGADVPTPANGRRPSWVLNRAAYDADVRIWDGPADHIWERLGLGVWFHSDKASGEFRFFIPPPVWLVLWAILPWCWIFAVVRHRRVARRGRCTSCGYDLRASAERCPECGTPVGPAAAN